VGLPTSSALIENNPPPISARFKSSPGVTIRHAALASHSIMGPRLLFPPCTHTSSVPSTPSRTDFPTTPGDTFTSGKSGVSRLNHDRRAGTASIHPSSAYHPLLSPSTPVLYGALLFHFITLSVTLLCTTTVRGLSTLSAPPDLLSDAPDALVGLAWPLLTPILPAPDPCQFAY
jgi:hypothetical protein